MSDFVGRDSWLMLPREAEALMPELLASLSGTEPEVEHRKLETLICRRDSRRWMTYIRECSQALLAARSSGPTASPGVLATILRDQFRLAAGIMVLDPADEMLEVQLSELARG